MCLPLFLFTVFVVDIAVIAIGVADAHDSNLSTVRNHRLGSFCSLLLQLTLCKLPFCLNKCCKYSSD